jgi:hypothetical protein
MSGDEFGYGLASKGLAALLDWVEAHLRRYVVLGDDQACAATLWVAHTYAVDCAYCTPYLAINSPEKRSGKTRLLEALATVVATPWFTGGTTKAALVRKIHADAPTLLLDESDAAFNGSDEYAEALRGVLNNGYTRGKPYTTCVGQGAQIQARDFHVFCPKAIAGIGRLPDTVADRSIPIRLKRRAPGERVDRFRQRHAETEGARLANALHLLRETDGFKTLDGAEPDLPDELDDRAQDVWEPLLAIADLAGGPWPDRARGAAKRLSGASEVEDDSIGVRLLADCRPAFDGRSEIPSAELVAYLNGLDEAPWAAWGKRRSEPGLTQRDLANLLRPYGIGSVDVHKGEDDDRRTYRGYRRGGFVDAWARYLSPLSRGTGSKCASAPNRMDKPDSGVSRSAPGTLLARLENVAKPFEQAEWRTGADESPDTRRQAES